MTYRRTYDPTNRHEVLSTLRREIRTARLKVTFDKKQGRQTSPRVKLLAEMELPTIVRQFRGAADAQTDAVAQKAADIRAGRRQAVPADDVKYEPVVFDAAVPAAAEPDTAEDAEPDAAAEPLPESPDRPVQGAAAPVITAPAAAPVKIEPAEDEHSGHVTLYLPKVPNRWLGEHHDDSGISYPGIVPNAINWAPAENRLGDIFAPDDNSIPANDIFGWAPALPKVARGSAEPETRPLRFRKDHMQVIISLARTWTADKRNAFFVGTLTAYRDHQDGASA